MSASAVTADASSALSAFGSAEIGHRKAAILEFPSNSTVTGSRSDDHLEQMIRRLCDTEADDLSTAELLSCLFSFAYGWTEAKMCADRLLRHFGSLGGLFAAHRAKLAEVVPEPSICFAVLKTVSRLQSRALREPVEHQTVLSNLSDLYDYLRLTMANEDIETARLLFLNAQNALLKDELHSKGTLNHTPVYPREVVKRVIELRASAIIIVHNHPSGDPTPSKEDVNMTRTLRDVLSGIGVSLHDSIIVGKARCISLKQIGEI